VCIKGVYKIQPRVLLVRGILDRYTNFKLDEVSIAEFESSLDEIVKEFLISSETMKRLAFARN
jgi:hypothetical protein